MVESMRNFISYCSEKQTLRALQLGAPINTMGYHYYSLFGGEVIEDKEKNKLYSIPTTQQMLNWLRKKGFKFVIDEKENCAKVFFKGNTDYDLISPKGSVSKGNKVLEKFIFNMCLTKLEILSKK